MAAALLEGDPNASLPYYNKADCDRAAIGYEYEVRCVDASAKFAWTVIQEMTHHYRRIDEAVGYAYRVSKPLVMLPPKNNKTQRGNRAPRIDGDPTMTLHGLYATGINYKNDGATYVWYWQDLDKVYTGPR